jgi:putative membrane protein
MAKEKEKVSQHLARHVTVLANERTFLAYIRTSLTLIVAGLSFIQFFERRGMNELGNIFVVLGVIVFIIGLVRYRLMVGHIKQIKQTNAQSPILD